MTSSRETCGCRQQVIKVSLSESDSCNVSCEILCSTVCIDQREDLVYFLRRDRPMWVRVICGETAHRAYVAVTFFMIVD